MAPTLKRQNLGPSTPSSLALRPSHLCRALTLGRVALPRLDPEDRFELGQA
jgi:hypothetical protein